MLFALPENVLLTFVSQKALTKQLSTALSGEMFSQWKSDVLQQISFHLLLYFGVYTIVLQTKIVPVFSIVEVMLNITSLLSPT